MAKYVVTGNNVSFNGTDVSASVTRAELAISSTEVDVTDFASGGWTEVVGGLKSGSVSIDFQQDFGVGGIGAVLTEDLVGTIGTADKTGKEHNKIQGCGASRIGQCG